MSGSATTASSFSVTAAAFSVSVGAIAAEAAGGGTAASAASLVAAVVGRDRADSGGGLGVIGRDLHVNTQQPLLIWYKQRIEDASFDIPCRSSCKMQNEV